MTDPHPYVVDRTTRMDRAPIVRDKVTKAAAGLILTAATGSLFGPGAVRAVDLYGSEDFETVDEAIEWIANRHNLYDPEGASS